MWEINSKRTNDEKEVQKAFGLKFQPIVKSLLDTDLYKFITNYTWLIYTK